MIKLFEDKHNCCGCTACYSICPKGAITMNADTEGFLYPQINFKRCVACGLCKQVCDFQDSHNPNNGLRHPLVFAAKHKDEAIRMSSTSGGAFTAISDYILSLNGVVYGVAFDKEFNVIHDRAETKESRDRFKGSKYVQSCITGIFSKVANDLSNGRYVLFTGTPCQCAGLKKYIQHKRIDGSSLLLCDIICHGTPSPILWREHINSLKKKHNSAIISYNFRSKVNGWHTHTEKVSFSNGHEDCSTDFSQKHKYLFYSHVSLRPSCHYCKYTSINRISDITIADFWGIEKTMRDFDDDKGVSLILINTACGSKVLDKIKKSLELKESDVNACLQPQLQHPASKSPKREVFWKDYHKKGYNYVVRKYTRYGIRKKLKIALIKTFYPILNLLFKRSRIQNVQKQNITNHRRHRLVR